MTLFIPKTKTAPVWERFLNKKLGTKESNLYIQIQSLLSCH